MDEFVVERSNSEGLFCFFEDDGDTGYFYLYEPEGDGILDHLHIYSYSSPKVFDVTENDVEVVWSKDGEKCGVKIWGKFYGVFDLFNNQKIGISIKNKETPPIQNSILLRELVDG